MPSAVHRPLPWPSFTGVHAEGDEVRPLPWPSFRESYRGWYFPGVSSSATSFSVSIPNDEWVLPPWDSAHQAAVSYYQLPCANQIASFWPGSILTSRQMLVVTAGLPGQQPTNGDTRIAYCLSLVHCCDPIAVGSLNTHSHIPIPAGGIRCIENLCVFRCAKEPREAFYCLHSRCLWRTECVQHRIFDWNSSNLYHPCVYFHQLQLASSRIQGATIHRVLISMHSCLPNGPETFRTCPVYLALSWSSFFNAIVGILCERMLELNWVACTVEQHANTSSYGIKSGMHFLCINISTVWKQNSSVVYALLTIFNLAALNYMDLWWITSSMLPGILSIFSIWSSVRMDVTSSIQQNLLLTRAYQLGSFGWEQMFRIALKYCILVPEISHANKELQGAYISSQFQWSTISSVFSFGLILVGTLCRNCQFVHSAMGESALLVIVQYAALQYLDLGRFTTAILAEVFSAWCCLQTGATCSVQSTLLLSHAYQLTCDQPEGSRCCVLFSLNLCIRILLADSVSLGVGVRQAVFGEYHDKSGQNCVGQQAREGMQSLAFVSKEKFLALMDISSRASQLILCWEISMDWIPMMLLHAASLLLVVNNNFHTVTWTFLSAPWDPGDVRLHGVICASRPCFSMCLASGTTGKIALSSGMFLNKELHAPWDPGGHMPEAIDDGGLRASRMLRGGECHGPCGWQPQVTWAIARSGLQAQGRRDGRVERLYLKEVKCDRRGVEEPEPGQRTLARVALLFSNPLRSSSSSTFIAPP